MNKEILKKQLRDLTSFDFEAYPVWKNDLSDEASDGELAYVPVENLPVESLKGKIIGVPVKLANGTELWARLSGIRLIDARYTEHHLSMRIEKAGKWFALQRYYDPGYHRANPDALAKFLGMNVDDVFPITYDIRPYVVAGSPAATGVVFKEPRERLSKEDLRVLRAFHPIEGAEEEQEWRAYLKYLESQPPGSPGRKGIDAVKARLAEKMEGDRKTRAGGETDE